MSLAKEMEKAFGDAFANIEEHAEFLSTGYPPLNKIINGDYHTGGFPKGRIIEMFGPSSSGKTLIACQIMIEAQKAGGAAIFCDHERSFHIGLGQKMGLNVEAPYFVRLKPNTWEESNNKAMQFAKMIRESGKFPADAPIVAVFDSVAAMIPKSVFDKGIDEYTMNDTTALARVASTTLKVVKSVIESYGVTCIYLNQIRTKPGVMFGDPTTTPGGSAMEFFADLRIQLGRKKITKDVKGKKVFIGQKVTAKCVKNKFSMPFQTTEWDFLFNEDGSGSFDMVGSLVDHCVAEGFLKKDGTKIVWTNGNGYARNKLVEAITVGKLEADLHALLPVKT